MNNHNNWSLKCFTISMCLCGLFGLGACSSKSVSENENNSDGLTEEHAVTTVIDFIRGNHKRNGEKVTIVGYLCTHDEGPWLCADPNNRLKDAIKLEVKDAEELLRKSNGRMHWFEENVECPEVRIDGVLRLEEAERSVSSFDSLKVEVLDINFTVSGDIQSVQ